MHSEDTGKQEYIYRNIIENMQEGVLTIDLKGFITSVNPVAEEILEIKKDDLVGKRYMEVFFEHPENDDFNQTILDSVYESAIIHNRTVNYFTGEKTKSLFITTSFLKRDVDGNSEKIGVVAVFNDITELQELRDAVKAMEKIKLLNSQLEKRNKFIRDTFGRYMSDAVVDSLIEQPENLKPGGEKKVISIIMTDLRGFTTMSELLSPEAVVAVLNNYYTAMNEVIHDHQGVLLEIIGDALLIIFGAPVETTDHVARAVCCALQMQIAMEDVNLWNKEHGFPAIEMGIGVNTGPVTLGTMGSEKRAKYGLVGSLVNLTARIESYTTGGQILVSADIRKELKDKLVVSDSFEVRPKGVKEPVTIYEIRGIDAPYDIYLPLTENDMVKLQPPLPVKVFTIDEKHCATEARPGLIVSISEKEAAILIDIELTPRKSVKLQSIRTEETACPENQGDDLYAMVDRTERQASETGNEASEADVKASEADDYQKNAGPATGDSPKMQYMSIVKFTWLPEEFKKIVSGGRGC